MDEVTKTDPTKTCNRRTMLVLRVLDMAGIDDPTPTVFDQYRETLKNLTDLKFMTELQSVGLIQAVGEIPRVESHQDVPLDLFRITEYGRKVLSNQGRLQ